MDWRTIGPTTPAVWRYELTNIVPGGSPMLPEAAACHAAAREHSALALAMAWVEQKYGTYTEIIPAANHNPFSVSGGWDPVSNTRRWRSYANYAEAVVDWYNLLTNPSGLYAGTGTVAQLISIYAPNSDEAGQEERYVNWIATLLPRYRQLETQLGDGPPPPPPPPGTGRFNVGDQIRVAAGPLNIRPQPGTGNVPLGSYLVGTEICVREGPVAADSHEWYRVDGYQFAGWVAGDLCTLLVAGGCR